MSAVSPPSVLIDATPIPPNRGGVGRYVDGIVPALVAGGVDLTVVCHPRDVEAFTSAGARVVSAPASVGRTAFRFLWEQFGLPRLARRLGVEVIHSVHYTFPIVTARRRVVTVHDLTFFSHPEVHGRTKRFFFRTWIRADRLFHTTVLVPSAATGAAYSERTGASADRVVVAHLGFDRETFHPPTPEESRGFAAEHPLAPSGWIAFLGTLEPRKNVVGLITGYMQAMSMRAPDDRPALLLAGSRGWDADAEPAIERASSAGFEVRKLGYLPLEHLSAFLGDAVIVAYPSLGEGFGLPVLEAMAARSCVLTTRELSLPEVGGDAVAYTDTTPDAIAGAISRLLDDPELRRRLRQLAVERATEFTWARSAHEHVRAYVKAVA